MAIPSTLNVSPLFVSRAPAWEKGVSLVQTMGGSVFAARSGLEQRQQRRTRAGLKLSYKAYLNSQAQQSREARTLGEIAAPLWVPMWTERANTANALTGTTLNLDRITTPDFFAPGDWILLRDATLGDQFRQIDEAGSTDQQVILVDDPDAVEFPISTACWPCRLCIRSGGQADFRLPHADSAEETLTYVTL